MNAIANPPLEAFVSHLKTAESLIFGQAIIRPSGAGYELRHQCDANVPAESLAAWTPREARSRLQFNDAGAYRPIRTSPDLLRGWRVLASNETHLGEALECVYPGSVADWFAAQSGTPPVTHYRDFTQRQTGMYRITAKLTDDQASKVASACCSAHFCLRQRLWTVPGLDPDTRENKSMIPCLEPCAVLMEMARKACRIHQEESEKPLHRIEASAEDLKTLRAALETARDHPEKGARQADFADPLNPRRVQWLLSRLPSLPAAQEHAPE